MSWSSFLLMCAFVLAAFLQYGLAIFAIADLRRRDHLRGGNKVTWTLVVLCIPFLGTLLYVMFATDGLPLPRPAPADTWPGRRWRLVRSFKIAGESVVRGAEVPKYDDPWEDLPTSHDPYLVGDAEDRRGPSR